MLQKHIKYLSHYENGVIFFFQIKASVKLKLHENVRFVKIYRILLQSLSFFLDMYKPRNDYYG